MNTGGLNEGRTYEIIVMAEHKALKRLEGMRCFKCGRVTYDPNDLRNRYCPSCQVFHDDADAAEQWQRRALGG
jgi:hypothetical protein